MIPMGSESVSGFSFVGKRVHFVVPRYHTNMIPWVTALQNAGATVTMDVVTTGATEDHSRIVPTVLYQSRFSLFLERLHKKPGTNKPYSFPSIIPYFARLKSLNAEIIVIRDPSRYVSILTMALSRVLPARVLLYHQAPVDRSVSRLRRWLIHGINAIFKAKWISPVSSYHVIQESALLPGHHFVPFVSATNVIRKTSLSAPIRLLSIGKFEPRKNHILLLKTLPALDAAGFSISLTLIGECSTEKHQSEHERISLFIRENELSDRVTVLTNQPAQSMSRFYMDADLFILPSSAEPASVSVIEALGFGLPVICSNQNGTKCYLEPGVNGDVFEDGNLDSLILKMIAQLTTMTTNPEWMFEQCQMASEAKVAPDQFLNALSGAVA